MSWVIPSTTYRQMDADAIEQRQGGFFFQWLPGTRRVLVMDMAGRVLDTLDVGNIIDSAPASLDEIQDAIDGYCDRREC